MAFSPLAASAARIASYSLTPKDHFYIEVAQAEHRIRLINSWRIAPSSRILEIGCGQGNCTTVLAEAVGPNGHVDAIDPGSPDYGAPFTLRQAQEHISGSAVGNRVSWHHAEPVKFLEDTEGTWDFAVLSHCIWYFDSPSVLEGILGALKGRANVLLVAEYALTASEKAAEPHVLAAMTRATIEAFRVESDQNIRTLMSPVAIKEVAKEQGWKLEADEVLSPEEGLMDGSWEVGTVLSQHFLDEIEQYVQAEKTRIVLRSARDGIIAAVKRLDGSKVRTMDVWAASFRG